MNSDLYNEYSDVDTNSIMFNISPLRYYSLSELETGIIVRIRDGHRCQI